MTDRFIKEFFEWFVAQNPSIPEGTEISARYDSRARQQCVTYSLGGETIERRYKVEFDMTHKKLVYEEIAK